MVVDASTEQLVTGIGQVRRRTSKGMLDRSIVSGIHCAFAVSKRLRRSELQ
jgi:hypothetical protein